MALETTTSTMTVTPAVIERVDGEIGATAYDDFRQDELAALDAANGSLRHIVCDLFATAIKGGDEAGKQAMAGGLFASRVLRYAAVEAAVELPVISIYEHERRLKKIADKLVPVSGQEIDYAEFESGFAAQEAVLERLERFRNPISRMAATAIFMLHEDVLSVDL